MTDFRSTLHPEYTVKHMQTVPLLMAIFLLAFCFNVLSYPKVEIEQIYATNTSLPLDKYSVINAIDGKDSTCWRAPLGARPDEGIMITFKQPVRIKNINIRYALNLDHHHQRGANSVIFLDGVRSENRTELWHSWEELKVKNGLHRKITSIYIQFGAHNAQENRMFKNENGSQLLNDTNKCIAVSEIRIEDYYEIEMQQDKGNYSGGNAYVLVPPRTVNCQISASSVLEPQVGYHPANLVDGRKEFGWAEGAENSGMGEWVRFAFNSPVKITRIKCWNGFQRSHQHFESNARAKEIVIGDGVDESKSKQMSLQLKDTSGAQWLFLPQPLTAKEFVVKVKSVYPGKHYSDLVLSELLFYSDSVPLKLMADYEEKKVRTNLQIKSKPLQKILNRKIHFYRTETRGESYLIIRSNSTFSYCREERWSEQARDIRDPRAMRPENQSQPASTFTRVDAEGNWVFMDGDSSVAHLKIFGKMHEAKSVSVPDSIVEEKENTSAFRDILTVKSDEVRGKDIVNPIRILW